MSEDLFVSIGELIRSRRISSGLSQSALGQRAGIGGRYISEIERGRRDVPLSTLQAIVERGLRMRLDLSFRDVVGETQELPAHIAHLAASIAELPAELRRKVVDAVRHILDVAAFVVAAGGGR